MNNCMCITTSIFAKRFHSSLSNYSSGYLVHKYNVAKHPERPKDVMVKLSLHLTKKSVCHEDLWMADV
jgi:hypothetical protein